MRRPLPLRRATMDPARFARATAIGLTIACFGCAPKAGGTHASPTPSDTTTQTSAPSTQRSPPADVARPVSARPRLQSASSSCLEGAQTIPTPGVCLKVPPGYSIVDQHPAGLVLAHDDTPRIRLRWAQGSTSLLAELQDGLEHLAAQDPEAVRGPTLDGQGMFVYAAQWGPQHDGPELHRALSVGRSPQGVVVRCSVEASSTDAVTRELFEACQTLRFIPA